MLTNKQWSGKRRSLRANLRKGRELIHAMAVDALTFYASEHNTVRRINELLEDLSQTADRVVVAKWFEEFGPVYVNGDGVAKAVPQTNKGWKEFNLADAEVTPFWTLDAMDKVQVAKEVTLEGLRAFVNRRVTEILEARETGEIANKKGEVVRFFKKDNTDLLALAERLQKAVA